MPLLCVDPETLGVDSQKMPIIAQRSSSDTKSNHFHSLTWSYLVQSAGRDSNVASTRNITRLISKSPGSDVSHVSWESRRTFINKSTSFAESLESINDCLPRAGEFQFISDMHAFQSTICNFSLISSIFGGYISFERYNLVHVMTFGFFNSCLRNKLSKSYKSLNIQKVQIFYQIVFICISV